MKYLKYLLVLILISVPLFQHLDDRPLRIWDEARLAVNAYEMNKDGNWLVVHCDQYPEMWNTKPPMMIWMQVACMKVFGVNDLSTRLPSAICAFITCLMLIVFSAKYLKIPWLGIIAALILVTSEGLVSDHIARTGDYDAPLSMFIAFYSLCFYIYVETKSTKYLYLTFAGIILAVLTKSIAGLFFLPALFLFALYTRSLPGIFKNKHTYFGILLFILFIGGYYTAREIVNPGYVQAVLQNEIGGRYFTVKEGHSETIFFYYDILVDSKFKFWILLLPCAIALAFAIRETKLKKFTLYCITLALTFFIIMSSSHSRLPHYDAPIFPFLALITATFLLFIFRVISEYEIKLNATSFILFPYIFLFLVFITPYQYIVSKTYFPKEADWEKGFYRTGYLWKDALKGIIDLKGYYYLPYWYNYHNTFYIHLLQDKGVKIDVKDYRKLDAGDKVIAAQNEAKEYVESHYNFNIIKDVDNIRFYQINGIKNTITTK